MSGFVLPWFSAFGRRLIRAADDSAGRTLLDAQEQDDLLDAIAAESMVADRYIYGTGAGTVALGAITSDARGILENGAYSSYTPTFTNVANLDASTAIVTYYFRIGNIVHVFGGFTADATAVTYTQLGLSLPVASNFTTIRQASGTTAQANGDAGGVIVSDTTNDRVEANWIPSGTGNLNYNFHFSYVVLT